MAEGTVEGKVFNLWEIRSRETRETLGREMGLTDTTSVGSSSEKPYLLTLTLNPSVSSPLMSTMPQDSVLF